MTIFDETVVAGVTGHMNGDHSEDNLLIARAFGHPDATASEMIGVDGTAGIWRVSDASGEHELAVPWPGGTIAERPEIRREVVRLYHEACERLGVQPRQEHGSAPAQPSSEGRGAGEDRGTDEGKPFSQLLREGTWGDHSDSEGASFMEDIMRGRGTLGDYTELVVQHYFMYEALEAVTARLAGDERFARFHEAGLDRMAALEIDLQHLLGEGWRDRIEPVPATTAYAARIREVDAEDWIAGIVAHHYTRYLGDLSGGQFIAKRVARQHGFETGGVAFYDFSELGSIADFKARYRDALDDLGKRLSPEERERMLEEVRAAYGFNTQVFVDLAGAKRAA